MDSKLKSYAILICITMIALVAVLVLYVNKGGQPAKSVSSSEVPSVYTSIGPNLSEEQLHAFLKDDTFFDGYQPVEIPEIDPLPRLYIQATSVWKDIRVQVLDEDGHVVTGQTFMIKVDGEGEYKDVDSDGLITIPALESGDYYVSLENVLGYVVPSEPLRVSVKDQLEYKVIDDISFYVYAESEIDVTREDTATNEAQESADDTEDKSVKKSDKSSFGIDVSAYQGDIDWAKVKASGVDFVIIRADTEVQKQASL